MKKETYKTTEIIEINIVGHRILATGNIEKRQNNLVLDNKEYYSEQIPPYTTVYMEDGHLTNIVSSYYNDPQYVESNFNEGFFYRKPVLRFYEQNVKNANNIIIRSVPYIFDIPCQFIDGKVIEPSFKTIDMDGKIFVGTYDECYKKDKIFNLYGEEHNICRICDEIEDLDKYYVCYDHYDDCVPFTNIFSKELKLTVRKIIFEDGDFQFRAFIKIPGYKEYSEDFFSFRLLLMYAEGNDTIRKPNDTSYLQVIRRDVINDVMRQTLRHQYPQKCYDTDKLYVKLLTVLDYNNGNRSFLILNGDPEKILDAIHPIAKSLNGIKRRFFEPSVGEVIELNRQICWEDFVRNAAFDYQEDKLMNKAI